MLEWSDWIGGEQKIALSPGAKKERGSVTKEKTRQKSESESQSERETQKKHRKSHNVD